MRLLIIFLLFCPGISSLAQQALIIKITGAENKLPLSGSISIKGSARGFVTDTSGKAYIRFLQNGIFTLVTSAIEYGEKEFKISIPYYADTFAIALERKEHEMEEVIVQSTRTGRTIANVPTRVEVIDIEEIDEKNNMRPGNVAMLLHESTGIQVQQTSATSGNSSIRIQGLDGRYTQLLKDGFANFGSFSSGLSVLEIPPLDLKQVEIIKGPASPLYGGGAIAGVINFISKTPKSNPEYNFILNRSNIGQSNIGGFASGRGKKVGYTMFALYSRQKPYDVDKDEFTEVPKSDEFTLHPKLFLYLNENTTVTIGNSLTKAERAGGDIQTIRGNTNAFHQYYEQNKTIRNISTVDLERIISGKKKLLVKQSFSVFDRAIKIPSYTFAGVDYNGYTDVSFVAPAKSSVMVIGGNFIYSSFKEKSGSSANRNNQVQTAGVYAQHTWDITDHVKLENGLRIDHVNYRNAIYSNAETFVLPRISILAKYNAQWSSRIGAGMGYKAPTLFTEQTETIQYRNVLQLDDVKAEKSYGGTADLNFSKTVGSNLALTCNHMFFYTIIHKPLVLKTDVSGLNSFQNVNKPLWSKGFETNARLIYKDKFKFFLGYTFTDTKAGYLPGKQFLPLVPKHKLSTALIYEKQGALKFGLEGYFTGKQYLSDGSQTPPFSEFGFMAEKLFKNFSLYVNFENFTDTRQSRYKSVVNGSHLQPTFDEVWTHTEGFVINGGIKIKLQ